ncbi:beta family protein [Ancylobacter sp. FA202]|uniref:beta family protein n=1 Tax=Ancylobacter sp. FA202 TaxID=1111106 RepID=UPI00037B2996|nr:beta family protein [Ancylobacter sp. FA202]
MTARIKPLYVSALRMKAGELMGVRDLAPDVADRVLPRFIVPPQAERENELQPRFLAGERFPDISAALAAHWIQRDALIESTYLIDEFGRDRMGLWLPRMFESARKARACPVPLVTVDELLSSAGTAYKSCIDTRASLKFGIVFSSGDFADSELLKKAVGALEKLNLTPQDCLVIADFHDADFANADVVAPVIAGVLEMVQTSALWRQIVFQGTNFPETNPADPGSHAIVPRNEWIAWRKAVRFEPSTADHMIFGDYAADCAKIIFKNGGGAAAIRHYRYATPDAWLVQRGADTGTHAEIMRKVCQEIVASGCFAGRTFSSADEYIFRTAHNAGRPGSAKEWRAVNTTHHITRVIADVGSVRGFEPKRAIEPADDQMALFIGQ